MLILALSNSDVCINLHNNMGKIRSLCPQATCSISNDTKISYKSSHRRLLTFITKKNVFGRKLVLFPAILSTHSLVCLLLFWQCFSKTELLQPVCFSLGQMVHYLGQSSGPCAQSFELYFIAVYESRVTASAHHITSHHNKRVIEKD